MIVLYYTVRKQEIAVSDYRRTVSENAKKRVRASKVIASQCIAHSWSFFFSFIPLVILVQVMKRDVRSLGNANFGIFIMEAFCLPLQGFLNALVYFRQRILSDFKRLMKWVKISMRSLLNQENLLSDEEPERIIFPDKDYEEDYEEDYDKSNSHEKSDGNMNEESFDERI